MSRFLAPTQEIFEDPAGAVSPEIEKMYRKGLEYLVKTQTTEGRWPDQYGSQTAVVGLATLTMLAHGDDPNVGLYSQPIRRGLEYIFKQTNKENGYIGNSMYNHGFATLALAEAYGAVHDPRIGPALQQAVNFILTTQARNPFGAWRYAPESVDADTTVSGAQLVALFAARNAGIAIPDDAINKALQFFMRCQTTEGGFGYTGAVGPNAPRTAIGALMLALARDKKSPAFQSAMRYLRQTPGSEQAYHFYYLYYASQTFFQSSLEDWAVWNSANVKALSATQNSDGSWDSSFGPAFSTAGAVLSLALNYRYLPIYER
jgi:hypothetical protein